MDEGRAGTLLFGMHPLALALSVLAHGAAAFALVAYSGMLAGTVQKTRDASVPLTVFLKEAPSAVSPEERAHAGNKMANAPVAGESLTTSKESSERPIVPLPAQFEPHYFRSSELSERPRVQQDISSDLGLSFADVPAQTVILRLFINEEGSIDRVVAEESYLPPDRMDILIDAFSQVKFHPGIRNSVPVKSQLKIAVRLDSLLAAP